MIKIELGKSAGSVDFDVGALDLLELLATDVTKSQVEEVKIGKSRETVVSLGVVDSDTSFKVYGKFNVDGFSDKDPNRIENTVEEISKIVVYDGKKEVFTLSGLKLTDEDLADAAALQAYVDAQSFALTGNNADNILGGGAGDDSISGAAGEDILTGYAGDDRLSGGANSDIFAFAPGDGADVITDFRAKGGERDEIDLTAYGITFEDLTIEASGKKSVLVSFGEGTDTILLEGSGLKVRDVGEDDFTF